MNKLESKRAQLELVESIFDKLKDVRKDLTNEFKVVGKETEQATRWKTGELIWDDAEKTIPHYNDKWGYVPIPESEMTDATKEKLKTLDSIEKYLESLI